MAHGARAGGHRTGRIDGAPYQNAAIVADQSIDSTEKTRMHFYEIDRATIGDGGLPIALRYRSLDAQKSKATIDDRNVILCGFGKPAYRRDLEGSFRGKDEAHGLFHEPGRNQRVADTRNVRPEDAAHRRER